MSKQRNLSHFEDIQLDMSGIDDEVLRIFLWVIYGFVCLTISVFGIVTNIINISCFVGHGIHDSINVALLALSISDLGSLITLTFLNVSWIPAVMTADFTFDPMEVSFLVAATPHFFFTRVTSYITALITLERCLCVIVPLQVRQIFTPKRTSVIITFLCTTFITSGAPAYCVNKLGMKFSLQRNKTIFGLLFTEDRQYVQKIMFIINNFTLPLTAFVVIVICTVIIVITLRKKKQWRKKSTASEQVDRISTRNQRVSKMAIMISTLFIICFIPFCIITFVAAFEPSISYGGNYIKIGIMAGGFCCVLESINSSANIFIYYKMSSRFRYIFREFFIKTKGWNLNMKP